MFLTRLGFNPKAVITGDITQIDLPNYRRSGLLEALDILKSVDGLSFIWFDESDVVRHQLVQRIIRAYDEHKSRFEQMSLQLDAGSSASSNGNGFSKPSNGNGIRPLTPEPILDTSPDSLRQSDLGNRFQD